MEDGRWKMKYGNGYMDDKRLSIEDGVLKMED